LGIVTSAMIAAAPARLTGQHDTLRLTQDSVLARVVREHPETRAGAASITVARERAADLTRYPNPSFEIERTTLSTADNVALLQPMRWP